MIRKFLLLVIFLSAFYAKAQLLVNLQLPVIGLSTKNQLWNMTLVNSTSAALYLKSTIIFADPATGQVIFTGTTALFTISTGTTVLQANSFMPVIYNVVSPGYNIDNNPNGFLPVGHFNVCYQFDRFVSDNFDRLTEECEEIEVEPISPPMLLFPEDAVTIQFPKPVFNWIPPTAGYLFSTLSYDIKLVQLNGNQSEADAIQQNAGLFNQQQITALSINYPASLPDLDTGITYAWQVTARNNNAIVGKSDVWTFRVGQFGLEGNPTESKGSFAKLQRDGFINYFLSSGWLQVEYENYPDDDTVMMSIRDLSAQNRSISLDSNYLILKPGSNLISLDITNNGFVNNHLYQFEIFNSRNEKWVGKFFYRREQ